MQALIDGFDGCGRLSNAGRLTASVAD